MAFAAVPIASSITFRSADVFLASTHVEAFETAINMLAPPTEEGDYCHICSAPAKIVKLHIFWCSDCATALLQRADLKVLGQFPKNATLAHAMEHAFRWHRIVRRLLRADGNN